MQQRTSRRLEGVLWVAGLLALLPLAVSSAYRELAAGSLSMAATETALVRPDDTWSAARRRAYEALSPLAPESVATLIIPATDTAVPVFPEETERAMTLGAAYLSPARPLAANSGNIALSAHRDGPFRQLRELEVGDELRLRTARGERRYVIEMLDIVEPEAVHVLADREYATLTLLTCYPFYYVGSAPRRYVVTAREEPG